MKRLPFRLAKDPKNKPYEGLRLGRVGFANGVSAPANRFQKGWLFGVSFDFDTKVFDVRADQLGSTCARWILPDLAQELLTGQDLARARHEIVEQLEFGWRQEDNPVAHA